MALALLLALVAVAMAVLLYADGTIDIQEGRPRTVVPERIDFDLVRNPALALLSGKPAYPWYGDSINIGHAPPYIVALAPFALVPRPLVVPLTGVIAAALMLVLVIGWARGDGGLPAWTWAVALSMPVVSLVRADQLMSAIGVLALSVALWAQRRQKWWLVGLALAIAMERSANALPVMAMLLVGGWGHWRSLLTAALTAVLFWIPLVAVAYGWDHNWIQDYLRNLSVYPIDGPLRYVRDTWGQAGVIVFNSVDCLLAGLLVRRSLGRPLDLDRAALGLALTAAFATIGGVYTAVFVLPALIRLARRRGFDGVGWAVAFVPWLVVVGLAPYLLGPAPRTTEALLSLLVLIMLAACYPLLRGSSSSRQRAPEAVG